MDFSMDIFYINFYNGKRERKEEVGEMIGHRKMDDV